MHGLLHIDRLTKNIQIPIITLYFTTSASSNVEPPQNEFPLSPNRFVNLSRELRHSYSLSIGVRVSSEKTKLFVALIDLIINSGSYIFNFLGFPLCFGTKS